jgi:hypothetical protein
MTAADAYAMVRKDTGGHLGTVGKRYSAIQNAQAFDFLDGVLGEFGARYETAGSLYGGQKVWMLAHMPKQAFQLQAGTGLSLTWCSATAMMAQARPGATPRAFAWFVPTHSACLGRSGTRA